MEGYHWGPPRQHPDILEEHLWPPSKYTASQVVLHENSCLSVSLCDIPEVTRAHTQTYPKEQTDGERTSCRSCCYMRRSTPLLLVARRLQFFPPGTVYPQLFITRYNRHMYVERVHISKITLRQHTCMCVYIQTTLRLRNGATTRSRVVVM